MKKLSVLFTTFAVAATLSLAGCANAVSSTPDLPVTHTVTFTSNGTTVASQAIEDGQLATQPTDPTNKPHKFVGWYNGSAEYDFASKVTSDLVLTAKWSITNVLTAEVTSTVHYQLTATKNVDHTGSLVLDFVAKTFNNYTDTDPNTSYISGTFEKTGASYKFTVMSAQNTNLVGKQVSYTATTELVDGLTVEMWMQDPEDATMSLYGFGIKKLLPNSTNYATTTKVTTKTLTSEEVE